MGIDIRTPIGLMFSLIGVMLVGYGMMSEPAIYARSLGINVNLIWGFVLLLFGGIMLALGISGGRRQALSQKKAAATSQGK